VECIVDCILSWRKGAAGVELCGGVVMGVDKRVQYKGRQGLEILPGDAGCRGELGGEAYRLEVVWGLGDCSSELRASARVLRSCIKGLMGYRFWQNKIIRRGAGDRRR
jgi:hypothetical protein